MTVTESGVRVLVIESGSVLDQAIKNAVMSVPELRQVMVLVRGDDPAAFIKEILKEAPDVIVLSEVEPVDQILTLEILHNVLADSVRLIVVRLEDNILEVYDKQRIKTTREEDLITIIRHHRGTNAIQW